MSRVAERYRLFDDSLAGRKLGVQLMQRFDEMLLNVLGHLGVGGAGGPIFLSEFVENELFQQSQQVDGSIAFLLDVLHLLFCEQGSDLVIRDNALEVLFLDKDIAGQQGGELSVMLWRDVAIAV